MENAKLEKIYYESFRNIDFINRYKKIMDAHNHPLDDILARMEKTIIKNTFKEIGYDFKISSPGQFYEFYETINDYSFKISIKISGGMITTYIYIYVYGDIVKIDYTNFAFIYRILKNNMEEVTNAPKFKNFNELLIILKDLISIYENFKIEFLKLIRENV